MTDEQSSRRRLPYTTFTECWYVPGETTVIDLIHPDDGLTLHARESAADILARHPAVRRMPFDEACQAADAAIAAKYLKDITEITEARYWDALEVLPPVGFAVRDGVESFRLSERLAGSITDIYARLGERYFTLTDDIRMPASAISTRVKAYVAAHPVSVIDAPSRPGDGSTPARAPAKDRAP
jgi:hypothetical protein